MNRVLAALAAFMISGAVLAADLPVKAPASSLWGGTYPYDNSGFFVGLYTELTDGSVSATVPGVGSASLTSTTAGLGLTVGYAWGRAGSPIAFSLEGDACVQNFNGNNAGLSLQGPLCFEERFIVWAPWDKIIQAIGIPNLFGNVPPFRPLQPGQTASNLQFGIAGALGEVNVSNALLGVESNKVWRIEPKVEFWGMEQVSNGMAVRAFSKIAFPDKGEILGYKGAKTSLGPQYTVGFGAYF